MPAFTPIPASPEMPALWRCGHYDGLFLKEGFHWSRAGGVSDLKRKSSGRVLPPTASDANRVEGKADGRFAMQAEGRHNV
jgi:hypothetical protein